MIANDFVNEVIINTEEDLLNFLNKRPAHNSNHFILTFNENGFPELSMFVKDDDSVIYFLGEKNGEAFVSCGNSEKCGTEIFYENTLGSSVTLASENIVSSKLMIETAKQFLMIIRINTPNTYLKTITDLLVFDFNIQNVLRFKK